MLQKSPQSAIVMSGIAVLAALSTFVFWELLRHPSSENIMAQFQSSSSSDRAMIFLALIIIFVLVVLPGAFLIRNWSDGYFGKEGAIRWAIFGIIFGCLGQVRVLIPEGILQKGLLSFLIEKSLSLILGFFFLYLAHFLAFKLLRRSMGTVSE